MGLFRGKRVVIVLKFNSRELKIDLDLGERKSFKSRRFNTFMFLFIKLFTNLWHYRKIEIDRIRVFETNKGFHITIILNKEIDILEVLLIQAILGDKVRECYNYARLMAWNLKNFNFFSKMKRKTRYEFNDGKLIRKEIIYYSEEKVTKKSNKLLRKLLRIQNKIKNGYYYDHLGEFF